MKRIAFTMKLFPGMENEYKKRHDQVWPELARLLKDSGISEYYIFLDEESSILFATYNLTEGNKVAELREKELMKKWWSFMKDIMETNADHSPVSKPLSEMFYMP